MYKRQSHDNPVAQPLKIRNKKACPEMRRICETSHVANAAAHAIASITAVLIAVARFEFMSLTPIFANIAVSAAKNAESRA